MTNIKSLITISSLLVLSIFSIISSGCNSGYRCVKKEFRHSFKNETNSDSLIHFDGYYYRSDYNANGNFLMFYKNGLAAYRCLNNFAYDSIRLNRTAQPCGLWGTYSMSGDTIKARYTGHGTFMVPYGPFEMHFLIRDKEHFEVIYDKEICYPEGSSQPVHFVATYTPSDKLPRYQDCWLLKEKWFWKNENDWKMFMDNTKGEK
ncbi:hypothetical protein [Pinibacter aurantiacus]|uniref:hypothetical protein n=1 Tax=Pinibacter aurantiacus TaxID=2851599 RepID=UPI001C37F238|nr:hypothetical protein [Pinibacter aurantiacus]